jgi:hypothetical protein
MSLQVTIFAQRKNFWLKGIVRDSTDLIANAHVVNLNTEKGTFTGDYGQYRIVVAIGDTISVTSVQHETFKQVITDPIAFSKKLNVVLKKKVIELDEIVLKQHELTGILRSDRKQVPKDSIAAVGRNISELILELAEKEKASNKGTDEYGVDATTRRNTDPTKKFKGLGVALGLGNGNKKELKIQKITSDKFTSKIIYDTFGQEFFLRLKIPEKYIFRFIDYCKQFNLKELYNQEYLLQIAVIFERESHGYIKKIQEGKL